MDLRLAGLKAIVTGGTRGIGRRVAEMLADEGCSVAVCGRDEGRVAATVADLEGRGARAFGRALHARQAEPYKAFLADACAAFGGLDILVASVSGAGGMDSEKNWNRNFEIDLMGAVRAVEATLPALKKSQAGAIVMIGTMAAGETFSGPMAYNALKASIAVYAKQLSQTLMKRNIRVNVVSPGPTVFPGSAWEMVRLASPRFHAQTLRRQPTRRMAEVDEIARCVLFLASPAASWVTGTNLRVDGGFTKGVQF